MQLKHQSLSAQLLYDSQFYILPFLLNDVSEWKKNKWHVFENAIKCTRLNIQSIRHNPMSNRKSCHCICFQTSPGQHSWRSQFKPITMRLGTDQSQHGRVETDVVVLPILPRPSLPPPAVTMVQMMESQCEYFMYFPAVPITDLSDPARYRTLPRRSHLYLGETVRFLLVLRCRDGGGTPTEHVPGTTGGSWATGWRRGGSMPTAFIIWRLCDFSASEINVRQ